MVRPIDGRRTDGLRSSAGPGNGRAATVGLPRRGLLAGAGFGACAAWVGCGSALGLGLGSGTAHANAPAAAPASGIAPERPADDAALQAALRSIDGLSSSVPPDGPIEVRTGVQAVQLALPDLVENGAVVPITVTSLLPGTEEIAIVVATNPDPLVVRFFIPAGTEPSVATRIKIAGSGRVYAVVRAEGGLSSNHRDAQVTVGGCE